MSPEEVTSVCQSLARLDTIEVSRDRLATVLRTLIVKLPDMLAEQSDNVPMAMRLAMPGLRMFLTSESMQETLSSESLVEFVWEALLQCQNPEE